MANENCIKYVPNIRRVLKSISEELTPDDIAGLIYLARDELPKGQTQNITCLKLFTILEERQLIDTDSKDFQYLLDLLTYLPRLDLRKKLLKASPDERYETEVISEEKREVSRLDEEFSHTDGGQKVNWSTVSSSTTYTSNSKSVTAVTSKQEGFLQDPDLLNSTYAEYHEIVQNLESVTNEKDDALKNIQTLKSRINVLEFEAGEHKEEHEKLISERNNALAAKSELVFRETEAKRELTESKIVKSKIEKEVIVLKNQLKCYIEDFQSEQSEKEQMIKENESLLGQLGSLQGQLEALQGQLEALQGQLEESEGKTQAGNGRIRCKRCGLVYVESNNPVTACVYHAGRYGTTGSIRKKQEWSCCKNQNQNAPGCCKKKHISIDVKISPGHDTVTRSFRVDTM